MVKYVLRERTKLNQAEPKKKIVGASELNLFFLRAERSSALSINTSTHSYPFFYSSTLNDNDNDKETFD
jgi:hypothetical protein